MHSGVPLFWYIHEEMWRNLSSLEEIVHLPHFPLFQYILCIIVIIMFRQLIHNLLDSSLFTPKVSKWRGKSTALPTSLYLSAAALRNFKRKKWSRAVWNLVTTSLINSFHVVSLRLMSGGMTYTLRKSCRNYNNIIWMIIW